MSIDLLFNPGSYLMVSIESLPLDIMQMFNKSEYHVTIAYEPKESLIDKYFFDRLDEEVIITTKSISFGDNNIARIDIDYMNFLDGIELNRIDDGIPHITLFIPPSKKPKDAGFFEPIEVIEYKETLIGKYKLKNF